MVWRELPFFRLLIPFVLGLALGPKVVAPGWLSLLFGVLLLSVFPLKVILLKPWGFSERYWPGVAVSVFVFGLGLAWRGLAEMAASPQFVGYRAGPDPVKVVGIIKAGEVRDKHHRMVLSLRAMKREGGQVEPVQGRILVYLSRKAAGRQIARVDDTLVFEGRLLVIRGPANPEAFDYRSYLAGRHISHQVFIEGGAWQIRAKGQAGGVRPVIRFYRQRALEILDRHLPDPSRRSIAAALLIGSRDQLDPELKEAYAASGAIHVLAVSGLHVGIVYIGVTAVLSMIPLFGPWWRWVRGLVLLSGVWGFVILAGAPPSAVRAGCMFSLFIVGRSIYRTSNIFNTIAASAFITLCLEPELLSNVGFQLSYVAVAGIVYFQPWLYRKWYCPWHVVDYLWKLLTVAVAAQLGTLPLSLFYFHQFPVYFWLSGWVAVPAATLILGCGISLLVLDQVPVLGVVAGKLLSFTVGLLNAAIMKIESLPGALMEGLWLGLPGLICGYLWVLGLAWIIRRPQLSRWHWLLGVTALSLAVRAARHWEWHSQRQVVIYEVSGATLIDFITGREAYTLRGGVLKENEEAWAARNYRWSRGINRQYSMPVDTFARAGPAGNLVSFAGHFAFVADGRESLWKPPSRFHFLFVRNDPPVAWLAAPGMLKAGIIIIDGSNSWQQAQRWEEAAGNLGVPCWNVRRQGALVIDLRKGISADGLLTY